eukprot:CAMPEP_0179467510 /NCGR_PEP_ID=MMETSP0799-20121207/48617_1 /TAXON_ID=46947 /ORGANISM="Geminigera cryophila, Strain CCMP2564" /LENGTH=451 /DNA_ID=CAMNT_0021272947 /DNA_START=216 /DNA_END=1568 /DNA_ORIENTATION=+
MSEFVHMDPSRWRRWYFEAYASSARFNERAANAAQQQLNSSRVAATASSKKWQIGQDSVNDMPVALVNMPFRKDRRAHSLRLLHELGLQNVHAPALVSAEALNMSNLIEKGLVVGAMFEKVTSGDPSASAYVARAADQIAILRHFVALGHDMFAIFEDDLWLAPDARAEREAVTGEGGERKGAAIAGESTLKRERRLSTMAARERIQSVVTALPATADLLYLEFCGELCAHLRYTVGNTLLARAKHPFCSAAIIFTRKGALKVLELTTSIFDGLDLMYPKLISDGRLEAYVATPPILYQDASFGSNAQREGTENKRFQTSETQGNGIVPKRHGAWLMACSDAEACEFRVKAELHGAARVAVLDHDSYPHIVATLSTATNVVQALCERWAVLATSDAPAPLVLVMSRLADPTVTDGPVVEIARFGLDDEYISFEIGPHSACYLGALSQLPNG